GSCEFNPIATLADYMFVYQNYDIKDNVPAMLGVISKERITSIIIDAMKTSTEEDKRYFIKGADSYLKIDFNDFDFHYIENKIPKMKEGYAKAVITAKEKTKNYAEELMHQCMQEYKDGWINIQYV